jgi:hypothetical protein
LHIAPDFSCAAVPNVLSASAVTLRLGVLDCSLVIPAVAAKGFVEARGGGKTGGTSGLAVATSAESGAAPGRELVDLGSSLSSTRV